MNGIITLYDRHGNQLDQKRYDKYKRMRYILEFWGHLYGKTYSTCYYQIAPELRTEIPNKKAA